MFSQNRSPLPAAGCLVCSTMFNYVQLGTFTMGKKKVKYEMNWHELDLPHFQHFLVALRTLLGQPGHRWRMPWLVLGMSKDMPVCYCWKPRETLGEQVRGAETKAFILFHYYQIAHHQPELHQPWASASLTNRIKAVTDLPGNSGKWIISHQNPKRPNG